MTGLSEPLYYYPIAAAGTILFIWMTLTSSPALLTSKSGEWLFLGSVGLCLFALRWPFFLFPNSINVDEGGWVACAIKASRNIVPWLGVESTTSGPLNCDVLVLPALLGFKITFVSARVVGLCLVTGSLWAVYFALKWLYDPTIGRLAVVPALLLLSFTKEGDFIHYSSELLPVFLTTTAFAAATFVVTKRGSTRLRSGMLALAGFCVGCTPFAKLQAAPLALAEFVVIGAFLLVRDRVAKGRRIAGLAILTGSAALMPVAMLISVLLWHTLKDAIISYFGMAMLYIEAGQSVNVAFFFHSIPEYTSFLVVSGLVILVALFFACKAARPFLPQIWGLFSATVLLATSIYAIYAAHRPYCHYLLLSVMPLTLLTGNALGLMLRARCFAATRRGVSVAFVSVFVPTVAIAAHSHNGYGLNNRPPLRPEVVAITRYVKPGDLLAVWGWKPEYYVQTGTIMATRDSQTQRQIDLTKYREYFRQRFMDDLARNLPTVFVDGVSPGSFTYNIRKAHGIEDFPTLDSFVRNHYVLKEEINGVRIFVIEDKAAGNVKP